MSGKLALESTRKLDERGILNETIVIREYSPSLENSWPAAVCVLGSSREQQQQQRGWPRAILLFSWSPPFRCQFLSIPLAPQKALLLVRFDVSVQTHVCGLLGCCFRRIFGFFLRARDFSRSLFVVWRCFAFDRRVREPTETEGGEATTLDVLFGVAHARV